MLFGTQYQVFTIFARAVHVGRSTPGKRLNLSRFIGIASM